MPAKNPKPYDQAFKSLSDRSPRGLLDIFGVLPHEADAQVEPLPRDVAMPPMAIDTAYFIRERRRKPYIAVFEALTSWEQELAERLACYGALLAIKYRLPVRLYVLPLARHACPAQVPTAGKGKWGDVTVRSQLRWIKPWEIDGQVVLSHGWPELDPWAVLFRLSDPQLDDVLERLNAVGRGQDASLFRLLAGMRYRKNKQQWTAFLERTKQMIRPELFLESLAVEDWRDEGRLEEARTMIAAVIQARFPKLDLSPSINLIKDLESLHALVPAIVCATNEAAVRRAVKRSLP